jgi:NAD(P)-dependent dehydrogenase (short-subunit alcohol dehydrogenase family)
MTLALNHLSYFVMSVELLDLLKQTATRHGEARIVNVSSDAHRIAKKGVNFEDIHLAKRYSAWGRYGESKLMNILFTKALAQRLEGTGVICNAVHPGFVATGFAHNNRSFLTPLLKLSQKLFARTEEKGAETLIYLSISPEVKGTTGGYFFNNKPRKAIPIAHSEEQRERLWTLSEELVAGK